MRPIISVITACYNSEKTIERTIESVLKQDLNGVEYLIVDGGSNDSTLTIVKRYIKNFGEKIKLITEKDYGCYDAMNKGIRNSKGDFIIFLNSDDYFGNDVIKAVIEYIRFNNISTCEIVYGNSTNVYINNRNHYLYRYIKAPSILDKSHCDGIYNGMCGVRHQSMFVGREVYKMVGLLDLKYRLHADWNFMIKSLQKDIKYNYINENISFYSMYGASTKSTYIERHIVRKDNHLYKYFDMYMILDFISPKHLLKSICGPERWNELLCTFHIICKNVHLEEE